MEWFTFKGKLTRKIFIIRVVSIWIPFATLHYFIRTNEYQMINIETRLITYSIVDLLIVLFCLPSIVKRLRSINWSVYLSSMFVLITILDFRNILLIGISLSEIQTYFILGLAVTCLILFIFLIFKRELIAY